MKSQTEQILSHLKKSPLTPLQALIKFGVMRLGARVFELRQMGYNIVTERLTLEGKNGKKVIGKYRLIG